MPPQSQSQAGPEAERSRRAERRMSGRAQRRAAQEQAAQRKRLMLIGGAVAAALIIAFVVFLATRPQDLGPPVLAAEPLPATIPVEGMAMGPADAQVTIVEWGDYT